MKKAISYLRRSTRNQEGSFDIQRKFITSFAESHGYEIVSEFVDTKSGRSNERDGLVSAVKHLEENQDVYLLLWKVDRLARNLKALGDIVEPMLDRLRFVELGDSAPNLFVISTLSVLAKAESDAISQRVKASYETMKQANPSLAWGNPQSLIVGRKNSLKTRREQSAKHYNEIKKFIDLINTRGDMPWSVVARHLNELGIRTIRGNNFTGWSLKKFVSQFE